MFLVLGMNKEFFLSNPSADFVGFLHIDDNDVKFFKNPYTSERKKMSEVLMRSPSDHYQFMIRTPEVQEFIYETFQCQNKV